ncbi:MAG: AEC family transporter [Clostridia bacterium]|nr:AEC family transporter [Clostridia bacterium]
MNNFTTTLITVAIMLAYAIPGFIFVKAKAIKPDSIGAFARVLLYVCQPALFLYSFNSADYSPEFFAQMGIFFGLCMGMQILVMVTLTLILKSKFDDVRNRICTIASALANVGFFGVPLLESIFPEAIFAKAVVFSSVFSVSLNLLSWTLAVGIISWDRKKMSVRNMIINPTTITLLVAIPLFLTGTKLEPSYIEPAVTLLAKMTSPLCMLILGMRLATVTPRDLFLNPRIYLSTAIKNVIYPLLSFLIIYFIPLPTYIKVTFFILGCCPAASMVLNMSELIKEGQTQAACSVLISTMSCIVTIPLLALMIPLL